MLSAKQIACQGVQGSGTGGGVPGCPGTCRKCAWVLRANRKYAWVLRSSRKCAWVLSGSRKCAWVSGAQQATCLNDQGIAGHVLACSGQREMRLGAQSTP